MGRAECLVRSRRSTEASSMPRTLQVSTANAAYQRIEVLKRNRTKRHRYGEFVVEGVRSINGALAAGWTIRAFAYPRGRPLSRWASSILEGSTAESHFEIEQSLFETLSDKEESSELLAVVEMRPDSVDRLPVGSGMVAVVLDRPVSPGNLGTLVRSCDAFGAAGVIATGHGVDVYDPATIRASVGSFFAVPCIALSSHREIAAWVADVRRSHPALRVVGTDEGGARSLREYEWPSEAVIVVGNETSGLSHAYRELCDDIVSIPMTGTASSLNAAVATSIVLYAVASHRTSIQNEGQTETAGNC
jgi:23S rRNA (uridine2479-2'-O)-methyltransferase